MKFLDCTLRDGGYYTQWDFNDDLVDAYLDMVNKLPIDCIEVGYRSIVKPEYLGQYYFLPDFTLNHIRDMVPNKKIAIMFNEKETTIDSARELLKDVGGLVDIVRLAVSPDRFDDAVRLSKFIRDEGFEVGFNLMYMSKIVKDNAVLDKLETLNGVVTYFNLVDSYGGVYPSEVKSIVRKVKDILKMDIGFHGHNNLEMSLVNAITALQEGCTWIDGTITGMGRGAGNLKTELFLVWLASQKSITVDFNALAYVVDKFERLREHYGWGASLPYMISGANSLPQKDVMDWLTKRTYSMNSIINALQNKQDENCDLKLPELNTKKTYTNALLIAGGPNAVDHSKAVRQWVNRHEDDLVLVHVSSRNISHYEDLDVPQIYCLVGNEGVRLEKTFNNVSLKKAIAILPPFPREMGTYIPEVLSDRSYELSKVEFTEKYHDSHTAVSLQTIIDLKASNVYSVGFDGYGNSFIGKKEQDLLKENDYLFRQFIKAHGEIISFTPSQYSSLTVKSIYIFV
jgi:4-hydroxy 2-oxovalerate aldolase